jgi:hypothetical protein
MCCLERPHHCSQPCLLHVPLNSSQLNRICSGRFRVSTSLEVFVATQMRFPLGLPHTDRSCFNVDDARCCGVPSSARFTCGTLAQVLLSEHVCGVQRSNLLVKMKHVVPCSRVSTALSALCAHVAPSCCLLIDSLGHLTCSCVGPFTFTSGSDASTFIATSLFSIRAPALSCLLNSALLTRSFSFKRCYALVLLFVDASAPVIYTVRVPIRSFRFVELRMRVELHLGV